MEHEIEVTGHEVDDPHACLMDVHIKVNALHWTKLKALYNKRGASYAVRVLIANHLKSLKEESK